MDASWNYAINIIHAKGLKFGTDLVFTMGPLGYLTRPDPDYAGMGSVLAFLVLTYALLAYGVVRCARRLGSGAALIAASVLITQVLLSQHFPDVWQAAYVSIFLAAAAGSGLGLWDLALSGVVAGITLLLKVNEGFTACAVFACLVAYSTHRTTGRKTAHVLIAMLPVLVLVVGMQAIQGNGLSAFSYLRNALYTLSGFSRAASMPGPLWQSALAVLYFALIFAVPAVLGSRSTVLQPGVLPALILAFTGFKHGMVRQDGHADMVMVKIALAALFVMIACNTFSHRRVIGVLALFGAGCTASIVAENQTWLYDIAIRRFHPSGIVSSVRRLASFGRNWEVVRAGIHKNLRPLRLDEQFHHIIKGATVDAFPENVDVIRANGWNYLPRPGIQSSSSYVPSLDALNGEYLLHGKPSQYAIFVWYAIDARHPFFQDPRTLMALLDTYDVVHQDDKALLLGRRTGSRFREPEQIGSTTASWDEPIAVPSVGPDEAVMARVQIVPSLRGDLRAFLFRASSVNAQVTYSSGRSYMFRVVSANLSGGAIISPLPLGLSELAAFLDGRLTTDPVVKIQWASPGATEYLPTIRMSWYRIRRRNT